MIMKSRGNESPGQRAILPSIEIGVALLLTAAIIYLQVVTWQSSGALWRDECSSISVVSQPSVTAMWAARNWDSFPCLWHALLRGWIGLGLGASDLALRGSGLVVGLGILGLLWWSVRQMGGRAPLVSLLLLGLSPIMLVYGDSVRAYGLGIFTMILALVSVWRVVNNPSPWRIALAVCAAVLCVQSLYSNSIMLLAISLGGISVALRRRQWKTAIIVLAIGAVAAASMLPYVIYTVGDILAVSLVRLHLPLKHFVHKFNDAIAAGAPWMKKVWNLLAAFVLIGGAWRTVRPAQPATSPQQRDLPLFAIVTTATGVAGLLAFLNYLKFTTESWYYLPIMSLAAVCLDAGLESLIGRSRAAVGLRLVTVVLLAALLYGNAFEAAHTRLTNIDQAAHQLKTLAGPDDLIVVNPLCMGITVHRYYDGPTRLMTVPDINEFRYQPNDKCKKLMQQEQPIAPVMEGITATLKAGHRAWIVGRLPILEDGELPGNLPPAPHSPHGWYLGAYENVWSRQISYLIRTHSNLSSEPLPNRGPVQSFENVHLFKIEGWRE
jgi:hypothetical protein